MIDKLIEQYSKDILNKEDPKRQEEALTNVIVELLNNLNDTVQNNNIKKKKDIKIEIEKTTELYNEFVAKINEIANEEILKPNGITPMLKKQFKIFF